MSISVGLYIGSLLLAVAIGAAGGYYAQKFTDQRHAQECRKLFDASFNEAIDLAPDLLNDIKTNLQGAPLVREFILKDSGAVYGKDPNDPIFIYTFEEYDDLRGKIHFLEVRGFIQEITYNSVLRYEMLPEFLKRLKG